jgi:HEAT repeat protein
MSHKGEAAAALARLGSPEAREALLRLATDPKETAPTRAAAMAGLGRLLDPNFAPSLARLTLWLNYRASTDLINQLYALL